MPDDDTSARLDAHRAAFFALALVVDEAKPGAFENIIEALATLESEARRRDMPAAYVAELRELRAGLESQHGGGIRDPEMQMPPGGNDPGQA